MPALSDYVTGTISLTNGSVDFTGTSTGWLLAGFKEGDTIIDITGATEFMGVIATIDANGAGTLTKAWEGPTLVDVAYRMRYQPDGARVSAQARNLIELLGNGNVLALAGLSGSANQVPMFTGPGAMTLVPKTDLVSGVAYDVQVDVLGDRDAYDGQAEGFSVLVADVGDGRAAVYAKASATSGDWTDPAYVTGPVGPLPDVTVGTVTTGDPGTDAEVTATPTVDGVELDFTIPAGRGLTPLGDYNPATAYVLDDAVLYNGSTWIALQATTGNAPPTLPTTSNIYWQLLARQGIDGSGTVNSVVAGDGIIVDNTDPTAPVVSVDPSINPILLGYLAGLTLANNATDANNDVDFASGMATSSDGSAVIELASAITKRLDAAWAVGTNNGGLFSGSKANSTWYHCFAILRPDTGVVDAGFDTSPIAANRPAAYTKYRRLGSILTDGSGNILAFRQIGDTFYWVTPTKDVDVAVLGTTATSYQVKVPDGVVTEAILDAAASHASLSIFVLVSPLFRTDQAPWTDINNATLICVAGATATTSMYLVMVNTSRQVRARSSQSSTTLKLITIGWRDFL